MLRNVLWLLLSWFVVGAGLVSADLRAEESVPAIAIGFYLPVVRDVPRKDVEVTLRFWIEELAQSVNLKYKPVRFYDDLAELKRDMTSGTINLFFATSMGIVQHFSPDELADGFTRSFSVPDHLLLVVRRESGIRRLTDLAGKRMALLDQEELSDVYLENLMLKTWRSADSGQFSAVTREKRSSVLVHRLFFGQSDAALINRNAYEAALAMNPQIAQRVQVLDEYSFRGQYPTMGLFSSRVAPEHREVFTQAFLSFNSTTRGRQVLQIYQTEALVRVRVNDLEPYRELLASNLSLKSRSAPLAKKGAR